MAYIESRISMLEPKQTPATSLVYPNSTQYRLPWWVEIKTTMPACTYYFGPFNSIQEAHSSQYGYIEDLMEEKAHGITAAIKQIEPQILTIEED
jgi:hypothetical protein